MVVKGLRLRGWRWRRRRRHRRLLQKRLEKVSEQIDRKIVLQVSLHEQTKTLKVDRLPSEREKREGKGMGISGLAFQERERVELN